MICFEDVVKIYQKELFSQQPVALKGLSFKLEKGTTLGLIGANGAGKSTTIKLIMDFIRPTQGKISLFGLSPDHAELRTKLGYLPEVASFPANLNILDLLFFTGVSCGLNKAQIRDRSEKWLVSLNLWDVRKRALKNFSKGMQQRANFALALINDPDLLILDEPMSGLDPVGRSEIIDLILSLKSQNKTILFCSHILEDVDKLVDQLLLLHKGQKKFAGSPADFVDSEGESSITNAFVRVIRREGRNG